MSEKAAGNMRLFILIFTGLIFSLSMLNCDGQDDDIVLGLMIPWTGSWPVGRRIASAFLVALDEINNSTSILPNRTISFVWNDTQCNAMEGLREVVDLWTHVKPLHAIIGPGCDIVCEPAALLASAWAIPMISWGCEVSTLSNKDEYPTFARTVGPYPKTGPMFVATMNYFNWKRIAILASTEHTWQLASHAIKLDLEDAGIHVVVFYQFEPGNEHITGREKAEHRYILEQTKEIARIVIICSFGGDVRDLMLNAYDLDMINGDYVFFTLDLLADYHKGVNTWMGDDGRDAEAEYSFNAILNIHLRTPHNDEYHAFEDEVRKRLKEPPFIYDLPNDEPIDVHAGPLYDAVLLFAIALHEEIQYGGSELDGFAISRRMRNLSFPGIGHTVYMDENGDRSPDFAVQDFTHHHFEDFADYHSYNGSFELREHFVVTWPKNVTSAPKDHPPCGWEGEFCPDNSKTIILAVSGTLGIVAVIFGIAFYVCYRKAKLEAEYSAFHLWKVDYDDIIFHASNSSSLRLKRSSSRITLGLSLQTLRKSVGCSSTVHLSRDRISVTTSTTTVGNTHQIFAIIGYYKGQYVAVKKVNKKSINITQSLLVEFKTMRDLQYENLNPFIGACIEPGNICLLSQYCKKGSVQDVLENDNIKLDDTFKMSIAIDICKGMEFLHNSSMLSHGRLKSSNCVIDSRWVCKITDYGMGEFRDGEEIDENEGEHAINTRLLWTSPERLRYPMANYYGTPKDDVYAYGIILSEIVTRGGPYSLQSFIEPKEIIDLVKEGAEPLFRPSVPQEACKPGLRQLMRQCWAEVSLERPTFAQIRRRLNKINGGKTINIVENMISMMEKYADHLEEIVDERTAQLHEEQNKTDQLLYRMLPRSVADALKTGIPVQAESFDEVTVCFSDIVDFTKLASDSSPMQVVDLLNDLYTTFDDIIDNHDVYKVETIGDAYLTASGLPVRNGRRHAAEIATMVLELLSSLVCFEIRHMPGRQLQLRIGAHTGPVVTGVVGLKMPRYCIFGDTVNTASRMESSGLALRVNLSYTTAKILLDLGNFILEERGEISVKGKKPIKSYWLLGRTDKEYTLPDLSRALSPSQHIFK
ncbi:atrial natriuretic peptide receptor 2-like [Glandiceps talaboti]